MGHNHRMPDLFGPFYGQNNDRSVFLWELCTRRRKRVESTVYRAEMKFTLTCINSFTYIHSLIIIYGWWRGSAGRPDFEVSASVGFHVEIAGTKGRMIGESAWRLPERKPHDRGVHVEIAKCKPTDVDSGDRR